MKPLLSLCSIAFLSAFSLTSQAVKISIENDSSEKIVSTTLEIVNVRTEKRRMAASYVPIKAKQKRTSFLDLGIKYNTEIIEITDNLSLSAPTKDVYAVSFKVDYMDGNGSCQSARMLFFTDPITSESDTIIIKFVGDGIIPTTYNIANEVKDKKGY